MYLKQVVLLIVVIKSSLAYVKYNLTNLCENQHEVFLKQHSQSGAVVQLSWNRTMLRKYAVCEFVVNANVFFAHPRGVFVTLQQINLRQQSINGDCIDFIQFERHQDGKLSRRICGKHTTASDDYRFKFFVDNGGRLRVRIELDPRKQFIIFEPLKVELYLTAFTKDCHKPNLNQILCSANRCIWKSFQNDGVINCFPHQCSDEASECFHPTSIPDTPKHSPKSKIKITWPIIGLVLLICVCKGCMCYAKKEQDPASTNEHFDIDADIFDAEIEIDL